MKKMILLFVISVFTPFSTIPQNPSTITELSMNKMEAIYKPDKMPEFPGGQKALLRFISKNLKYPYEAAQKKMQGRVVVRFIIDTQGKVKDAKIIKNLNYYCDTEALRVINMLPKWKPGEKDRKPVEVYYTLPINFRMQVPNYTDNDRQKNKSIEEMFNDNLNNR